MTEEQEKKCHAIIHSCAVACGTGNVAPIPGLGIATDMIAMTTMTMSLAGVFGGDLTKEAAKGIAIAAIKKTMLKKPIKTVTKELSKIVPILGQIVAPSISIAMVEAAGWAIAKQLENELKDK